MTIVGRKNSGKEAIEQAKSDAKAVKEKAQEGVSNSFFTSAVTKGEEIIKMFQAGLITKKEVTELRNKVRKSHLGLGEINYDDDNKVPPAQK